jgi:hypothetical protein
MNFDMLHATDVLSRTPLTLRSLLDGLPDEWIASNEGPETWSPFDVVGHLVHGERTDWIPRARIILSQGENARFTPFDRFAMLHESEGKTLADLLDELEELRARNLEVLESWNLREEQLNLTGIHPEFGTVTLSQLLATWVVHDLSHIAQIARVMSRQYREAVGPWRAYLPVLDR